MTNWIWFLAAMAFVGNPSDRLIIHFSSTNCPACRKIQPLIDQLSREGWSIQSVDSLKDPATADRWRVQLIPTVIVLQNGREVDRVVGSLEHAELKRRLTASELPTGSSKLSGYTNGSLANATVSTFYGPNHRMGRANLSSNYGPNHPLYKASSSSPKDLTASVGINHPYYSHYKKSSIASNGLGSTKGQPSRAARRPPDGSAIPELPESINATVRIRIKYQRNESVGTGTIIDCIDDEALVLTCGHLFRDIHEKTPISVEVFHRGEILRIPAALFDYRNDEVDLGLIKFRTPSPVNKVPLLPKGQILQEDEFVFSIGCDGGDAPSRRDTFITKLNRFVGPSNVEVAGAPVQGRSGGGLFDIRGRLIGVCIAADDDLDEGLFVGPEAIYAQLKKHNLNRLFE